VRQTYTNEVKCDPRASTSIRLDGNLIKAFQSGGDPLIVRRNYVDEREIRVGSRLIMNLNDMPEVAPPDALSTMVLLKFPYQFVAPEEVRLPFQRPRDDGIKDRVSKSRDDIDAFVHLVLDAYRERSVVPCQCIREDTLAFRIDIGDDMEIVTACFEVTGRRDDVVTMRAIKMFVVKNSLSLTSVKGRLKRMGAVEDNNCRVGHLRLGRGFRGLLLKFGDGDDALDSLAAGGDDDIRDE
jgi:hypothetical protein